MSAPEAAAGKVFGWRSRQRTITAALQATPSALSASIISVHANLQHHAHFDDPAHMPAHPQERLGQPSKMPCNTTSELLTLTAASGIITINLQGEAPSSATTDSGLRHHSTHRFI